MPLGFKRWRPTRRQGLCSHPADLWATSDSDPRTEAVWSPLRQQGLCSHLAHLWSTSDSALRSEAVGTPKGGRGNAITWPTCGPILIVPLAL